MQAVELLTRQHDANAREKELMKAVPENDTIGAVLSSVKISIAGSQQAEDAATEEQEGLTSVPLNHLNCQFAALHVSNPISCHSMMSLDLL